MTVYTDLELQDLIGSPRELLNVELKCWMDLSCKIAQAKIARELLALQNHGGGYLVFGFQDGTLALPDPKRPVDLSAFSDDAINRIVKKFADPDFHCVVRIIQHPDSGEKYPVVQVPGGATTPVRCKTNSSDNGATLKANAYLIRKPGAESTQELSGADWKTLIDRCLYNRKDEMLQSITAILAGRELTTVPADDLQVFRDAALGKLENRKGEVGYDGAERLLRSGRVVFLAQIAPAEGGVLRNPTVTELRDILRGLNDQSPLYVFNREDRSPYLLDDETLECFFESVGANQREETRFWRVSVDGKILLVKSLLEDGLSSVADEKYRLQPGQIFDAWRCVEDVARFLLFASRFGKVLADGPFNVRLMAEWRGLKGRRLTLLDHDLRWRWGFYGDDNHICRSEDYQKEGVWNADRIKPDLAGILEEISAPLLRRFSFFEFDYGFYQEQAGVLLRGR